MIKYTESQIDAKKSEIDLLRDLIRDSEGMKKHMLKNELIACLDAYDVMLDNCEDGVIAPIGFCLA